MLTPSLLASGSPFSGPLCLSGHLRVQSSDDGLTCDDRLSDGPTCPPTLGGPAKATHQGLALPTHARRTSQGHTPGAGQTRTGRNHADGPPEEVPVT